MRIHGWSPPSSPLQRFRSQWRVGCARGAGSGQILIVEKFKLSPTVGWGSQRFCFWDERYMPTLAHLCPPLPTFAHHCPPLPTIAHLCPPLPTFAHLGPPLPTFTRFKWARKGRGLTRRPLATTRRNASARTFGRYSRLCRRSRAGRFLANESQPARGATPMPSARNARTRRSHVVAATRTSQRCIRMASQRRDGRIPAAF